MKVTNARQIAGGAFVIDSDNGFQKTFADLPAMLEWAAGDREEGWETLQVYLKECFDTNPEWNDVLNLKGGTVTTKVTATFTRDLG